MSKKKEVKPVTEEELAEQVRQINEVFPPAEPQPPSDASQS
ncbi:hypothetical protein [Tellurirhabdus bombi]|nr:hypothetical protein [Tellurirhabdus bombi]